MYIQMQRQVKNEQGTMSVLGVYHGRKCQYQCFTLEDPERATKVQGDTCINAGEYPLRLREEGGMIKRYQKRFAFDHPGMIWLQNVENFEWVYIHCGVTKKDTHGCVLTGEGFDMGKMALSYSARAYKKFYKVVIPPLLEGRPVKLIIQ